MKHLSARGLVVCLLTVLYCQTGFSITFFEGSFQQAHQKSKQEQKRLLIYFTAKWCGPCRYMENNVFHSDSVTRLTDAQYVILKVDYDAWKTKSIVDKYRVASLPTFIIVDSLEAVEKRAFGRLTVSEFVNFLTSAIPPLERPIYKQRSDESRYRQRQIEDATWKFELGIQAGVNVSQVPSLAPGYKLGSDVGILLVWTKHRMSIRPGLSFASFGGKLSDGQLLRLHYIALPVNLSYLLRNRLVLGLPGGYRAHLTPYVSKLFSNPTSSVNSLDYGSKLGLSAFIGETSRLEAQVGYQLGMKDIGPSKNSGFYNRGLYFCVVFIL